MAKRKKRVSPIKARAYQAMRDKGYTREQAARISGHKPKGR